MAQKKIGDTLIGLGTPEPKKPPTTIKELLDENVRGGVNTELLPYEQRQEETSRILKIGPNGEPIMDNSPEQEAMDWIRINAKRRGIKPVYPTKEREGD